MKSPFGIGTTVLGGGALLLLAFLGVGLLLPKEWEAHASARIDAPAEAVYAYLDAPEGWGAWTPWPDSGLVRSGPAHGAGASIQWDSRELGAGTFRILEARPFERVLYSVEVGGGAMRTEGSIHLVPDGAGVAVTWHESGDLGRNPLMGYWGLSMERAQSTELQKGLERLGELVTDSARTP